MRCRFRRDAGPGGGEIGGGAWRPDPAAALVTEQRRRGIDPDPWTAAPPGIAERFDPALAVDLLWRPATTERAFPPSWHGVPEAG